MTSSSGHLFKELFRGTPRALNDLTYRIENGFIDQKTYNNMFLAYEQANSFRAKILEIIMSYHLSYLKVDKDWCANWLIPNARKNPSKKVISLLPLILFKAGLENESIKAALITIRISGGDLPKSTTPKFAKFCIENRLVKSSDRTAFYLKLEKKLSAGKDFLDSVLESSSSIAVVGNSPCEKGSLKGKQIDSHDYVCRFNNYPSNRRIAKDYGKKSDFWIRSIGDFVKKRNLDKIQLTILSGNSLEHTPRNWTIFEKYLNCNSALHIFNSDTQSKLIKTLGSVPSAGLNTCYSIYEKRGVLDSNNLFGFSFTDQLESNVKNIGNSPAGARHSWSKEKELFGKLVQLHGNSIHAK